MKTRKSSAVTASVRSGPKLRPMTDIPSVAALRDKVVEFENVGYRLLTELHEAVTLYARFGRPEAIDFPACADRRRAMDDEIRSKYLAAGEECPALPASPWCQFLEEFPGILSTFHRLGQVILEAGEPLDYVIDASEVPVAQRMIPALKGLTRQAMSHVHPVVYGEDGMGFFRQSAVPIPTKFAPLLDEIVAWRMLLEAAKQPTPVSKEGGWTLDELADEARASVKTLQNICKEAGIKRPKRGQHSYVFGRKQVRAMIRACNYPHRPAWCQAKERLTELLNAHGFTV